MNPNKPINVTSVFLPPKEEVDLMLNKIWESGWVTNQGALLTELEIQIAGRCGFKEMLVLANGTLALQIAIHALDLTGEILTTPFSYVATTTSIIWQKCKPVFVDIDPNTFNVDVNKIEQAITNKTSAMLFTHVFGNPCDIEGIDAIAQKHNLKVIYDAAHAFDVEYSGKSIFSYGDVAAASFHATKVYHMIEGGGLFTHNADLLYKMKQARNFGHNGVGQFDMLGINAKNSEFHAAVGLVNLKHIDHLIARRKLLFDEYNQHLLGIDVQHQFINPKTDRENYSYYPIVLKSEKTLLKIEKKLNDINIFPRRYFYPSLNMLSYLESQSKMPESEHLSNGILCLPISHELETIEVKTISQVIIDNLD